MRFVEVIIWMVFFVPIVLFGQLEHNIIESERDVLIQRVAKLDDFTLLLSDKLIYILNKKNQLSERIPLPDSLDKFMFATQNEERDIIISAFQFDDSLAIVSNWKYDIGLRSLTFVNSVKVAASGSLVFFSDIYQLPNGYLAGFTVLHQGMTNVGLVKISNTGSLELLAEINYLDQSGHRIFRSMGLENLIQLENNKYFITGFGLPRGFVVDSSLSTLVYLPLSYINPLDSFQWYDFTDPEIIKLNETELFITDHFPDKDAFFEEHMYSRIRFLGDSFSLEPVKFVSNRERTPKFMINVAMDPDSSIYMTSNMELGGIIFRGEGPTDFYLTKLKDGDEVWHKAYGDGKHFWRATSVETLDTCEVMITGTVYDYFGKETLSAFYTIVDCEGRILTSSHDVAGWTAQMYPNPVANVIHFDAEERTDLKMHYELYNSQGVRVRFGVLKSSSIRVSDLPAGSYYVRLIDSQGDLQMVNQFVKK